jgi:hypothetical protein
LRIARLLTQLTRKGLKFEWSEEAEEVFQTLKTRMCKAPVLIHVNPDKPFVLETDCSDYALASVLSQAVYDDATAQHVLKPVGYHSRTLNEPERNYEIYDKELLAIVECLKYWRVYLHSNNQPIRILSDHPNLVTVVPNCTLRELGTSNHSTPTAKYVDKEETQR